MKKKREHEPKTHFLHLFDITGETFFCCLTQGREAGRKVLDVNGYSVLSPLILVVIELIIERIVIMITNKII